MPCKVIFLALTVLSLAASAQDSTFLSQAAAKAAMQPAQEKAYLHLDRPYYAPGDTIWFKAYVTEGPTHALSKISNVLNVGLANSKDSVVQMVRLSLVNGLGWSDMSLADTLPAGRYRIVAYTNWMRNAGSEYFFDKPVTIINSVQHVQAPVEIRAGKTAVRKRKDAGKADIQFFPEGGSMVNGIRSKVAFKATGENSLIVDATGIVTDDSGQQITVFKSEHLGMGIFYLTPEPGKTYKASVTFADGSQCVVSLPAAIDRGFVMNINNSDTSAVRVTITASKSVLDDPQQYGEINLIAQSGGKVYYTAKSKVTAAPLVAIVPKNRFPTGIVQFTLFSANGEPLNERVAFLGRHDQLRLKLTAGQAAAFSEGQPIKIDLSRIDSAGKFVAGSFSAAVVNESVLPRDTDAEPSILSCLLLTSDLNGYIEKPGYYFGNDEHAASDLDVLMLTQGYRRFEWKKILSGDLVQINYRPEKTLSLSGHVRTPGGKPVAKAKVTLLSSQGGYMLLDTVTDQEGRFVFDRLMITDSLRCKIQAHTAKDGKNVVVTVDDDLPKLQHYDMALTNDSVLSIHLPPKQTLNAQPAKLPAAGHSKLLKEVVIKAKKPLLENSSNLNGAGNADQVLLFKNIKLTCPSIAQCLIGKLRDVTFLYDLDKMCYYPATHESGRLVRMGIMLDGISIDAETLNTLPPELVESVEVLRTGGFTSIYGNDGYNGLILVNTKKGSYAGSLATNITTCTIKGYYKAREFYSPKYENPQTNGKPDNRVTIYWNPNIITDKDGKASFEFYNADTKGTYRVIVEGIDGNGRIGRVVYHYTVQ
ncbi:MAG: TonB-dependent receptor plug domain-containing protein [Bacteroidetes bacterium]|nr:TonB-dependent receptor plug domain-containing protein [Bacteroidota bacterium]